MPKIKIRARLASLGLIVGLLAGVLLSARDSAPPKGTKSKVQMPAQQMVEVRGRKIVYYDSNPGAGRVTKDSGPTVIFLHGLGADSNHWVSNIGPVAEHYRAIALDQIGFGRSDKPLIDYRIGTFVKFLKDFMQALNISRTTLVGNSLGGWIAADFAVEYPEMVDKLVLVDAAGLRPRLDPPRLPRGFNPASPSGALEFWKFLDANKQWVTEDLGPHAFKRHLKNGDNFTITSVVTGILTHNQFEDDKLESIQARTLVVWGRDDLLIPLSFGERYQEGIRGAQLEVLDHCGHLPMMQEPKEFNKSLLKLLAEP